MKYETYSIIGGDNIFKMNLKQPYFNQMKKGEKTIEGRLYDEKRKKLNVGDNIKFNNGKNSFIKTISKLETFPSFEEAITEKNYKKLIPNANDKISALKVYTEIYDDIIKDTNHKEGVLLIYFD